MRKYSGSEVKEVSENKIIHDLSRLSFENEEYLIVIDKLHNYNDLMETVKAKGGHIIL